MAEQLTDPSAATAQAEALAAIPLPRRAHVRRLPDWLPGERTAVLELHAQGIRARDIAEKLDLPQPTVREILQETT